MSSALSLRHDAAGPASLDGEAAVTGTLLAPERRRGRIAHLRAQVAGLLPRLRFAVVHGGDGTQPGAVLQQSYKVRSWKSYEAVAHDIAQALHRLGARDVQVLPEDMRLINSLKDKGIDFVWLNTGGVQGMAPLAHGAAMMEMLGLPYVGHDPLTAALLDCKVTFKRAMMGAGLPTAPFATLRPDALRAEPDPGKHAGVQRAFADYAGPFIVKPTCGRASLHVTFVEDRAGLKPAVWDVLQASQNTVLVEKYLGGREFCIAACGPVVARKGHLDALDQPFTFAAVERVLDQDEPIFTSMDKRPITADRVRPLDPVRDHVQARALHALGRAVALELGLQSLVRLDVRADSQGRLHLLEANPKPDLKAPTPEGVTNLIIQGLAAEGMGYDDLILSLLAGHIDLTLRQNRGQSHPLLQVLAQSTPALSA